MVLQKHFTNVFSYAAGMEQWVNNQLAYGPLTYTFTSDFAIADWYGQDAVEETYERMKKEWLSNYEAFTEVVLAANMLSWAHHSLKSQGVDGRDAFIKLYADLFYRAKSDFYEHYDGNDEACDYFFRMTD